MQNAPATPFVSVPVRGAVFDCDGTLLDTMGLWYDMEREAARRAGHELTPEQESFLRTCTMEEVGRFFHEELGYGASPAAVVAQINEMAVGYYATKARPRPGVPEFLGALAEAGVTMAVASSSPHCMLDAGIRCAGLDVFIDVARIVSTDDVGVSKREPAAYDRARALTGAGKDATWVFEDAAYALRTLRAAGYHSVGVWDCDGTGTYEELRSLADVAVLQWGDLDPATFLSGAYAHSR